jgi:hypothetical protein
MIKTKSIIVLFCILGLSGCTDSSTPHKELIDVYAKVISVRESMADSATIQRRIDSVLANANYSTEQLERELRQMGATPQLFKSFYDSVSARLGVMREDMLRESSGLADSTNRAGKH